LASLSFSLRPGEAALEDLFEGDLEEDLVGDFVGEEAFEVFSSSWEECALDDFLVEEKRFFMFPRDVNFGSTGVPLLDWTFAAPAVGV